MAQDGIRVRTAFSMCVLVAVAVAAACYFYYEKHEIATLEAEIESEKYIVEKFHTLSYFDPDTWLKNQWLGIETRQNPNDVWIIQEILWEVRPDYVVETGTFYGGSALLWATILEQIDPEARVLSVDIEDMVTEARERALWREKVQFFVGSSVDPAIVEEIGKRVEGKKVVVVLDSNHEAAHVLKELELYGPMVSPGSYILVQDTNLNGHPVQPWDIPGPMEAVEEFLESHPEFEADRSRERLLYTLHPKGYLKRLP